MLVTFETSQSSFSSNTMTQEGHSPVLVFDSAVMVLHSPVMVLHSLVLVFTQSSFIFCVVTRPLLLSHGSHFVFPCEDGFNHQAGCSRGTETFEF